MDKFGCVDSFLPMLLIENSQQQRQTGAAIESFRNEMVQSNNANLALMSGAQQAFTQIANRRDHEQRG